MPLPPDFLPDFKATERGELVAIVMADGRQYVLHPQEAEQLWRALVHLTETVYDAKTRAGGLEPRSGEPI